MKEPNLDKIIKYCKYRISKANKYNCVNFWAFVALDLIDKKYKNRKEI